MSTRQAALQLVDIERNRQDAKWGEQNHKPQFWTGILGEEYGEYCQAVNETVFNNGEVAKLKGGYDNMMTELTHVAAVAIGAMEALMRENNRAKELSQKEYGQKCRQCLYDVMTAAELAKLGTDPCDTCCGLSNWQPKEEAVK